jgi:hypothetical protein
LRGIPKFKSARGGNLKTKEFSKMSQITTKTPITDQEPNPVLPITTYLHELRLQILSCKETNNPSAKGT